MLGLLAAAGVAGTPSATDEKSDPVATSLIACAPPSYAAALDCLDADLTPAMKRQLATEDGVIKAHFGLGLFIRNNWGLWKGGPLAQSMRSSGFAHPDDMSATILQGYSARLNHRPYDIQQRATFYRDYWQGASKDQKLLKEACASRKRIPTGDGRLAVCEWNADLKNNIMYFLRQEH